jgi:hypothetical protein
MEGKALIWFQDMQQSGSLPNWEALTQGLFDRFGPSAYDDLKESLTRLKQNTFVEDYKAKFEVLSNRLRDLSENYKLSCFLSGLKENIRLPVRMFSPKTLLAAYGLAKIQEEYVLNGRKNYRTFNWNVANPSLPKTGVSNPNYSGGGAYLGAGVSKGIVPIQKIFQGQMEERRKK